MATTRFKQRIQRARRKIEVAAAITPTAMKRPAAAPAIPKGTTAMHDLSQYLSAGPNLEDGFGDD